MTTILIFILRQKNAGEWFPLKPFPRLWWCEEVTLLWAGCCVIFLSNEIPRKKECFVKSPILSRTLPSVISLLSYCASLCLNLSLNSYSLGTQTHCKVSWPPVSSTGQGIWFFFSSFLPWSFLDFVLFWGFFPPFLETPFPLLSHLSPLYLLKCYLYKAHLIHSFTSLSFKKDFK